MTFQASIEIPGAYLGYDGPAAQIWIGETRVFLDGEEDLPGPSYYDTGELSEFIPIIKNGIVYVPATYFKRFCLAEGLYFSATSRIFIGNCFITDYLAGFKVDSDFSLLDKDTKERFKFTGKREEVIEGLFEETYTDGDIELVIRKMSLSLPLWS